MSDSIRQIAIDSMVANNVQVADLGATLSLSQDFTENGITHVVNAIVKKSNLEPLSTTITTGMVEVHHFEYHFVDIGASRVMERTVERIHSRIPEAIVVDLQKQMDFTITPEFLQNTNVRTTTYSNIVIP